MERRPSEESIKNALLWLFFDITNAFGTSFQEYYDKMSKLRREASEVANAILRPIAINIPIARDEVVDGVKHGWSDSRTFRIVALVCGGCEEGVYIYRGLSARVALSVRDVLKVDVPPILHIDIEWFIENSTIYAKDVERASMVLREMGFLRVYAGKDLSPPLARYVEAYSFKILPLLFLHFFLTEKDAPKRIYNEIVKAVKDMGAEALGVDIRQLDDILHTFSNIHKIVTAVVSPEEIKNVVFAPKEWSPKKKDIDTIRMVIALMRVKDAMYLAVGAWVCDSRDTLSQALKNASVNALLASELAKRCGFTKRFQNIMSTFSKLVWDVHNHYVSERGVYSIRDLHDEGAIREWFPAVIRLAEEVGQGDYVRERLKRMGHSEIWLFSSLAKIAFTLAIDYHYYLS